MGTKLYVGNLSYDTTEETLQEIFSKYGTVTITIIRYPDTGRSKGFGFAEFEDESAAQAALAEDGNEVDGRSLKVNVSKPREEGATSGSKLYVGNLSYDIDDSMLSDMFKEFGEIKEASVIKDRETERPKGFGFVEFTDVESAEKALSKNGEEVEGRTIVVRFAKPKTSRRF